jgi:hypothetical protein
LALAVWYTNLLVYDESQLHLSSFASKPQTKIRLRVLSDPKHPCFRERGAFAAGNIVKDAWIGDYAGKIVKSDANQRCEINSLYVIALSEPTSLTQWKTIDGTTFGPPAIVLEFRRT